jgi:hypothetical protein
VIKRLVVDTITALTQTQRTQLLHGPEEELVKKITGSKLVLGTRTLLVCMFVTMRTYNLLRLSDHANRLWSAKMAVLDLLASLIMRLPFERRLLYSFWTILFVTFVASIITTFSSCTPISLHWQVDPDPGDWYKSSCLLKIVEANMHT